MIGPGLLITQQGGVTTPVTPVVPTSPYVETEQRPAVARTLLADGTVSGGSAWEVGITQTVTPQAVFSLPAVRLTQFSKMRFQFGFPSALRNASGMYLVSFSAYYRLTATSDASGRITELTHRWGRSPNTVVSLPQPLVAGGDHVVEIDGTTREFFLDGVRLAAFTQGDMSASWVPTIYAGAGLESQEAGMPTGLTWQGLQVWNDSGVLLCDWVPCKSTPWSLNSTAFNTLTAASVAANAVTGLAMVERPIRA